MKAIKWLFVFLLMTGCATVTLVQAASVKLQWTNTDDYDSVRVYEGTNVISTVAGPMASNTISQTTVNVKAGARVFTVKGVASGLESDPSNAVLTNCHPNAPSNLK